MVSAGPSPRARRAARRPRHRGAGPATILAGRKEQRQSVSSDRALSEPSPQARGAGPGPGRLDHLAETIPAGAGSSGPRCRWRCPSWDHPRGREEQTGRRSAGPWRRDHPCQCEEQNMDRRAMKASRGHPRQREESRVGTAGRRDLRNHSCTCRKQLEHPVVLHRIVGVLSAGTGNSQTARATTGGPCRGPSPRARGAGEDQAPSRVVLGTITAGAGSRPGDCRRWRGGWDHHHHRGRGERDGQIVVPDLSLGPSPRARGAEGHRGYDPDHDGTILAGAGSALGDLLTRLNPGEVALSWKAAFRTGVEPSDCELSQHVAVVTVLPGHYIGFG